MKKLFILLLLSTSLSATANSILAPNLEYQKYDNHKIISEILINNLLINHMAQVPLDEDGKNLCASPNQIFEWIELTGEINPDATYVVNKLLKKIENAPNRCIVKGKPQTIVWLNSGGGYLRDGFALGELFRKSKNVTVYIGPNNECYSSCAAAFLGGNKRSMYSSSKLMFHAPYNYRKNSKKDIVCSSSDDKLLKYMQKMINKEDGEFLYKRTMSFCSSSDGWFLNMDAAKLLNITNID
jgi:ATP-dependent protease ClpP protease subunit